MPKPKILFASAFLLATAATAQEYPPAGEHPLLDPSYQKYVSIYREHSLEPLGSDAVKLFMRRYEAFYAWQFSADDAELIESFIAAWPTTELAIYNAVNAHADVRLAPYEQASIERARPDLMPAYALAMKEVNGYYNTEVMKHFELIQNRLSTQGSAVISDLLQGELIEVAAMRLRNGELSRSLINYERFAQVQPEVLARQVHREAAGGMYKKSSGETVLEDRQISFEPESGNEIRAFGPVVKKSEE